MPLPLLLNLPLGTEVLLSIDRFGRVQRYVNEKHSITTATLIGKPPHCSSVLIGWKKIPLEANHWSLNGGSRDYPEQDGYVKNINDFHFAHWEDAQSECRLAYFFPDQKCSQCQIPLFHTAKMERPLCDFCLTAISLG